MHAFSAFDPSVFLDSFVSLAAAFILGGVIGLERQFRQRTAGLRTNVLVSVGSALFVDTAMRFHEVHGGSPGTLQVMAYVVSGVGFLGAGVIMREGGNVRGLNTAATLWGSAAVGCAAGSDLLPEAILGALFVLAANTLLRPAVAHINRRPLDADEVEASYTIHVICNEAASPTIRTAVERALSDRKLHVLETEIRTFGEGKAEIEVQLQPISLNGRDLDTLIPALRKLPGVQQIFWRASTGG